MPSLLPNLLAAAALAVCAFILSAALTRILVSLLPKLGMMDIPKDNRRVHTTPVPRGGGLGMIIAFSAIFILFALFNPIDELRLTRVTAQPLLPLLILVPLGILDDRFSLSPKIKFLGQIAAAAWACQLDLRMTSLFGWQLPGWLSVACTIFWIAALINAFNMIDGIDGLACGVGSISALCMAVICIAHDRLDIMVFLLAFAGSLLGFLVYNRHPAKLFMGDTGSMFIGYILAVTGISLTARTASIASILLPLLACGVPFTDITFAVWRRLIGQRNHADNDDSTPDASAEDTTRTSVLRRSVSMVSRLGQGDKSHLHHRLLAYFGNNQRKTVWHIYRIALCMGLAAIVCCFLPGKSTALAFFIVIVTFIVIINRLAVIELWNSTEFLYHNFQSPRTGLLLSIIINPIFDLCAVFLGYAISTENTDIFILLLHVTAVLICLIFSRNYHVFWNFSSAEDYFRLIKVLAFGTILAWLSDMALPSEYPVMGHVHAFTFMVAALLTQRLLLHYLRMAMIYYHNHSNLLAIRPKTVAICGIVPESRLYRNRLFANIDGSGTEDIIGLIDHDRRFRHGYCYGMKVLGNIGDLKDIQARYKIRKIILTSRLPGEDLDQLKAFCRENSVELVSFTIREQSVPLD